ncbi:MAG: hypothetical protein IIC46_10715 [Planctomycetes bacterium]|nr:hypothetical protein [Planctomycetota bacterium]
MSSIPSNLARVPNTLVSQIVRSSLTRTQQDILRLQIQLTTGKAVNRASDNPVAASSISVLDDLIERRDQRLRNLSHGDSVLGNVDAALGDASGMLLEAKGIGSSQIGVGSDAETRRNQAQVIDAMINQLIGIANRQFQDLYLFGGDATANPPIVELLGGLQYQGVGDGMSTDLGSAGPIPITMSGEDAFGTLSARVQGAVDLNPTMTGNTRLMDLNGGRGFGISLGTINADVNGVDVAIDLSDAHTVSDVIATLEAAIQTEDPGATVAISAAGDAFSIVPSGGVTITITDAGGGNTAADLGLAQVFDGVTIDGSDVDPRITDLTPVTSLSGVTVPMGTIRITNAGQSRDLDLSSAATVQDIINAVQGLDLGVRVEIAETGDRLNFINELSGGQMAIAEVAGGTTATELGVRSFAASTLLEDFNNGLGVEILSGAVDPITGLPDPAKDLDFRITLKDGSTFDVDLVGSQDVSDVLDAINAAATAAGIAVPADFEAALAADGNGIELTDNTAGVTTLVEALNGSHAAENLGILGSTTSATLTGEDRATVAVDSVFSHLIALRDALLTNDERGITLATGNLETDINRLANARAQAGVRNRRVMDAIIREEDLRIQDASLRSQVQDLDFTEAAIRFSTLQQQLQAGLITASQAASLSLMDFLR